MVCILGNVFYNKFHLASSLVSNFSEIWWPLHFSAYSLEHHKTRQQKSCVGGGGGEEGGGDGEKRRREQ